MTIKEAIIKALEENKGAMTYLEVYQSISDNNYYEWTSAKTPADTVSAQLGSFIRKNDTRVKRVKSDRGFQYYLAKYESDINVAKIVDTVPEIKSTKFTKTYQERDLHKLLSSYLKSRGIYSKTIFHERSSNSKDEHQKWIHPDMVAINLNYLTNTNSRALMKAINKSESFELTSYELKKSINSDYELKKYYFQAVSNSSWANNGYLVAFEISSNLLGEMERLNQSFGIGVIELKSNPFESKILFASKPKELDFKTIDKLCEINNDFEKFILHTEKILTASEKYFLGTKKELESFCDSYLETDSEIEEYCTMKHIPYELDAEPSSQL